MQLAFAMAVVGFSTPHARSHLPAIVAIPGARAAPSVHAPSVNLAAPRAHRVLLSATPPTPPPRRPPPETPPSGLDLQLCLLDGNVLLCYSLLASIGGLFTSGELYASADMGKDLLDISLAFSAASSLIFSWLLAAALCGACREDWLFLEGDEHAQAPLGVSRLLASWFIAAPTLLLVRAASSTIPPALFDADAWRRADLSLLLSDAASADYFAVLIVMTLWRRWLLQKKGIL
mmetsp:Transcript_50457/g.121297  ORF Transcript_50457/g.121297 Transcript_50457/m.121297 type:complete len:233 (+) Transcript_50457:82-780(+)